MESPELQLWCRLAVLFRCRISQVAQWPAWEVRLLDAFLSKQPAAEERVEVAVATLCTLFYNSHTDPSKGGVYRKITDYLPYLNPWPRQTRYSDLDREILAALGS